MGFQASRGRASGIRARPHTAQNRAARATRTWVEIDRRAAVNREVLVDWWLMVPLGTTILSYGVSPVLFESSRRFDHRRQSGRHAAVRRSAH